jgi:hypothetical protein
MNYIKQLTRPNLHKITEIELLNIILEYDNTFVKNNEKIFSRTELVDKIFELWSLNELVDHLDKSIECLICCDPLTNGNNLTFECGHKFHSGCIVKHLLVHSTSMYSEFITDNEKKSIKIEYDCPQCKKFIDSVECDKNNTSF